MFFKHHPFQLINFWRIFHLEDSSGAFDWKVDEWNGGKGVETDVLLGLIDDF